MRYFHIFLHLYLNCFSKPPITHICHRRPTNPIEYPSTSTTSTIHDVIVIHASNNLNELHIIPDELQVGPRYNLQDHNTLYHEDKYGFSHVNVIVD